MRLVSQKLSTLKKWFLKRSRPTKIAILVILAVFIWFGYRQTIGKKSAQPQYQTAQVQKGTLVVSITDSGTISAANTSSVSTQASGVVSKVYVQNGQKVKAGDPILLMSLDQTAQQKYAQALSSYQSAQDSVTSAQANLYNLQNQMFVANQKFINDAAARGLTTDDPTYIEENAAWLASETSYTNQLSVINQAKTALSSAALSLQQYAPTAYAPISGTVTGLSLQVGSIVTPPSVNSSSNVVSAQKLANIVTDAAPIVTIDLSEIDAPTVKVGNRATVTLDAYPGKTFTGKIISIDTVGTVSSGVTSYVATISLDNTDVTIYPNMSAQASIITNVKDNVLLVPSGAIQTTSGNSYVRILQNGQVAQVSVETGLASDTQTEITSGLSEGETVVTSISSASSSRTSTTGGSIFGGGGFGGGGARVIQGGGRG